MKTTPQSCPDDKICLICGSELNLKESFHPRCKRKNIRQTYFCSCGYSAIKETEYERNVRLGII